MAHPLTWSQAKRHRRLTLTPADREDTSAHDLRDEGAGVDNQPDQQRGKFGRHRTAAAEVEAFERRHVEVQGCAETEKDRHGKPDNQPRRHPSRRQLLTGRHLPPLCPIIEPDRGGKPDQKCQRDPLVSRIRDRHWVDDAAIADKYVRQDLPCLPRSRRHLVENAPPEEQLQGQWDVAERLDIDPRQRGDEPIAREPCQPHHRTEDRRENDAERGDVECVGQPNQERSGIRIGR